jgi:hypothetical protein
LPKVSARGCLGQAPDWPSGGIYVGVVSVPEGVAVAGGSAAGTIGATAAGGALGAGFGFGAAFFAAGLGAGAGFATTFFFGAAFTAFLTFAFTFDFPFTGVFFFTAPFLADARFAEPPLAFATGRFLDLLFFAMVTLLLEIVRLKVRVALKKSAVICV